MAVESPKDRLLFLDPDEFGVEARYTSRDGVVVDAPVVGIFDAPATNYNPNRWPGSDYQMQSGAHFMGANTTFQCRTEDLRQGGKQRDKLVIHGVSYRIHEPKQDGTGMSVLILMEDDDAIEEAEEDE